MGLSGSFRLSFIVLIGALCAPTLASADRGPFDVELTRPDSTGPELVLPELGPTATGEGDSYRVARAGAGTVVIVQPGARPGARPGSGSTPQHRNGRRDHPWRRVRREDLVTGTGFPRQGRVPRPRLGFWNSEYWKSGFHTYLDAEAVSGYWLGVRAEEDGFTYLALPEEGNALGAPLEIYIAGPRRERMRDIFPDLVVGAMQKRREVMKWLDAEAAWTPLGYGSRGQVWVKDGQYYEGTMEPFLLPETLISHQLTPDMPVLTSTFSTPEQIVEGVLRTPETKLFLSQLPEEVARKLRNTPGLVWDPALYKDLPPPRVALGAGEQYVQIGDHVYIRNSRDGSLRLAGRAGAPERVTLTGTTMSAGSEGKGGASGEGTGSDADDEGDEDIDELVKVDGLAPASQVALKRAIQDYLRTKPSERAALVAGLRMMNQQAPQSVVRLVELAVSDSNVLQRVAEAGKNAVGVSPGVRGTAKPNVSNHANRLRGQQAILNQLGLSEKTVIYRVSSHHRSDPGTGELLVVPNKDSASSVGLPAPILVSFGFAYPDLDPSPSFRPEGPFPFVVPTEGTLPAINLTAEPDGEEGRGNDVLEVTVGELLDQGFVLLPHASPQGSRQWYVAVPQTAATHPEPPRFLRMRRQQPGSAPETDSCFVAGTLVHTAAGPAPIETVRTGDLVWARDEKTGEQALRPVLGTKRTPGQEVLRIKLAGEGGTEVLGVTANHPFYVTGRGFVDAAALQVNDSVSTLKGPALRVVEVVKTGETADVFNFAVDEMHTYFVGMQAAWVHNDNCVPVPPIRFVARTLDPAMHDFFARVGVGVSSEQYGSGRNDAVYLEAMKSVLDGHFETKIEGRSVLVTAVRAGSPLEETALVDLLIYAKRHGIGVTHRLVKELHAAANGEVGGLFEFLQKTREGDLYKAGDGIPRFVEVTGFPTRLETLRAGYYSDARATALEATGDVLEDRDSIMVGDHRVEAQAVAEYVFSIAAPAYEMLSDPGLETAGDEDDYEVFVEGRDEYLRVITEGTSVRVILEGAEGELSFEVNPAITDPASVAAALKAVSQQALTLYRKTLPRTQSSPDPDIDLATAIPSSFGPVVKGPDGRLRLLSRGAFIPMIAGIPAGVEFLDEAPLGKDSK